MLKLERAKWHKVIDGQTVKSIAKVYHLSEYAIVRANGLQEEVTAGQILYLPCLFGNVYTAREGDSKALLCGSESRYEEKNGKHLYFGKRVIL